MKTDRYQCENEHEFKRPKRKLFGRHKKVCPVCGKPADPVMVGHVLLIKNPFSNKE